jgi:predicted enzyme related to lactoylglutathione lyase
MAQPVVHFEVVGKDGDKTKAYYSELFGWEINSDNPMNYGLIEAEQGSVGPGIAGGIGQGPDGYQGTSPSTSRYPTSRRRWPRRRASAAAG